MVPSPCSCVIYRCCAQDELSPEDFLSVVKGALQWRQQSLAALYHVWKQSGAALIAVMREKSPSVGQVQCSVLSVRVTLLGRNKGFAHIRALCSTPA